MPGTNIITPNLGLVYPDPTDYTTPFDWVAYLNDNFDRLDNMKMVGGVGMFNAAQYLDATTLRLKWEDIITEATANGWLATGLYVFFPPGNYVLADATHTTSNITIPSTATVPPSVTLIGTKGSVIKTSTYGNTITDMISITGVDNVIISGLTFLGNADASATCDNVGIRVLEGDNVLITDCTFKNVKSGIMIHDNVSTRYCKHVWIKNNRIIDYFLQGIRCDLGQNVWIENNHIEIGTTLIYPSVTTGAHAIEFKPGVYTEESTCFIKGNTIIRPRRNGIQLLAGTSGASRTVVEGNTIDLAGYHASPSIETTKATRGSGIYSTIASTVQIVDNFIRDALADGIYAQDSTALKIVRNTIRLYDTRSTGYESLYGIEVRDCDNSNVSNNNIYNGYTTGVLSPAWAGGATKVRAIYLYSSDNVACKDNYITNWQLETNTCLLLTMDGNIIHNFAAASAEYLITHTNSTIEFGPVADAYVSPNEFSLAASTASTNQASVVVDVNGHAMLQMSAYNSTNSVYSRGDITKFIPKRISNTGLVLKIPVRANAAGFNATFDVISDVYSLEAAGTQAVATPYTTTASIAAPSSTYGPSIMTVTLPITTLPTAKSIIRITLLRKDTQATACAIYGMHIGMRDVLSGANSG